MPRTNKPDKLPLLIILTLLGVWLLTACAGQTASEPPVVSDPKISAPTPQEPGQEIGISVDVSSISGASLTYEWRVDGGEIVRGQNSPAITYRTPDEPGIYNVRVAVKWDDNSVEKITTIRVEAPAIAAADEPPADTSTPEPEEESPPTATPRPPTATRQPTSTLRPPTATPTPKPTNTPRPTPIPTATIDADPTVYDNFNNPAFDGRFNTNQWEIWRGQSDQMIQKDGILTIIQPGRKSDSTSLHARKYDHSRFNGPTFFEAKIMLDKNQHAGSASLVLDIGSLSDENWGTAICGISAEADAYCEYAQNGTTWREEFSYHDLKVELGTWHTFRMEVDPNLMKLSYFIDGQLIGSHTPIDSDAFKMKPYFNVSLPVQNWGSESTEPIIGYFDDVRIGQLGQ